MKEDKNVERKYLYFRKSNKQHVLAYTLFQKLENTKLTMAFISKLIPDFIENTSDKDIHNISSDEIICIVKDYLEGRIKLSTNSIYSNQPIKEFSDNSRFEELLKTLLTNNSIASLQNTVNSTGDAQQPNPVRHNPNQEPSQEKPKSTNSGRFIKNNAVASESKSVIKDPSYENVVFSERVDEPDILSEDEDEAYDYEKFAEATRGISIFGL